MYSDLGNSSKIFELRSRLKVLKQGQHSVTQYFSEIQDIWQELDLFINETPSCAECAVKLRSIIEKERVFGFLAGLNRNLDGVRGRLVARDPSFLLKMLLQRYAAARRCTGKSCWLTNQFCHNLILLPWCPIRFCPLTNMA